MAQSENDPREPSAASQAQDEVAGAPQILSQADLLSASGLRGALFAQWARQKRRTALEQRYGEDADALLDETGDTELNDWSN